MQATIALDDDLVAKARAFADDHDLSALVRQALESFVKQRELAKHLSELGERCRTSSLPRAAGSAVRRLDPHRHFGVDRPSQVSAAASHDGRGRGRRGYAPVCAGRAGVRQREGPHAIPGKLAALPRAVKASDDTVLELIEQARLNGSGIGYVDCHVMASAQLMDATLWTRDRRLHQAAVRLGLVADGPG